MDEPTANGIINWLIYVVVGLTTFIFGVLSRNMNGRMVKVEDASEACDSSLHKIEIGIHTRFTEHERDELKRSERRRAEAKADFLRLEKKVETGHKEIIDRMNEIAKK